MHKKLAHIIIHINALDRPNKRAPLLAGPQQAPLQH